MDENKNGLPEDQAGMILQEIRALKQSVERRVSGIEAILSTQNKEISRLNAQQEAHGENIDLLFEMLRRIVEEKGVPKPPRGVAVPKEDFYRAVEEHGIGRRTAMRELSRADVIVQSAGKNTVVCKLDGRAVRVILTRGDLLCKA